MRVAAGVEYCGAGFAGWQLQRGVETVQQSVERALSLVADDPIRVITAGRTDTGVHACCQVIHFDTRRERSERAWVRGATSNLPDGVAILWAKAVDQEFHARFSAIERRYRYLILNRPIRPTYLDGRVTWEYRPLEVTRMQEAARYLIGTHDFNAFRASACQAKSPVRELRRLAITRRDDMVCIEAHANAFLHHMVRNIAGVLMTIGCGERPPEWAQEVLLARDRSLGGVTAPPDGLYLSGVLYPDHFRIPACSGSCAMW
jgi:tRNA pseudouridine38-40 synthase